MDPDKLRALRAGAAATALAIACGLFAAWIQGAFSP